jgi:Tol biopolymer transport system component
MVPGRLRLALRKGIRKGDHEMHAAKGRETNGSALTEIRSLWNLGLAAVVLLVSVVGAGDAGAVDRVSIRSDGVQGNAASSGPAVSDFADCVAFYSDATNLVPNRQDTNNVTDVFLFDRRAGSLQRVSLSSENGQANRASQAQGFRPAVDPACTCVAFSSDATNLVPDDGNRATDIFLRTLANQATVRVSVGFEGEANGASSFPSISGGCGRIAFQSTASNLVEGDTNNTSDIFVYDRRSGSTARVNIGEGGEEANGASITPSISRDGRCVAFASAATNLLPGDTNGTMDIYVACDGVVTCRASVDSNGREANGPSFLPSLSADGNLVAFKSLASNLVPADRNTAADVFVHDCESGVTERVSIGNVGQEGNDNSFPATISADGRFVAFGSFASNLILGMSTRGQAQIYVRDREQGNTVLISRNLNGAAGNGSAPDLPPSISPDGNFVAFASLASDLVVGDTNEAMDAFSGGLVCRTDDDCPPGSICVDGECRPPATPTPTPTPECITNDDCPPGQDCIDGRCVEVTPTPTPMPVTPGPCTKDEDCPPGQICIEETGQCVTPRPTCTTDDDCAIPCTDPSECPAPNVPPQNLCAPEQTCEEGECEPAERCRSMRCVPPRCCEDPSQCFGVEACVFGRCECGGDCNLDGVIFGSEISTAINILAGVAPLSVCRAADIDGDGHVMGNEICLALSNLAQGCPDLLMPLSGLGQSRAGDMVTFGIGSAAGSPAETVTVQIDARGGGGEMVMAQIDLLYDPALLTVTDASTACRLHPRLTQQILRASLPDDPPAPDGKQRLRVFVGDIVLPTDTFDDGPIASCTFEINGDAEAGVASLVADHLNVSDAQGGAFGTTAAGGRIEIIVPNPVPAVEEPPAVEAEPPSAEAEPEIAGADEGEPDEPEEPAPAAPQAECAAAGDCRADNRQACVNGRCYCVADCNGDGNATINEVVAAVRAVLSGTQASCPAADGDGNGVVTVDEVMIGLGNLASGCPAD